MKVSELIAELNKMDPNALVIRNGHSDGIRFSDVFSVECIKISECDSSNWAGKYYHSNDEENPISAVHIH